MVSTGTRGGRFNAVADAPWFGGVRLRIDFEIASAADEGEGFHHDNRGFREQ